MYPDTVLFLMEYHLLDRLCENQNGTSIIRSTNSLYMTSFSLPVPLPVPVVVLELDHVPGHGTVSGGVPSAGSGLRKPEWYLKHKEYQLAVHDELLALCAKMHAAGERLTYDTLRARHGGGSRRDIGRALRDWHAQRMSLLAEMALELPEDLRQVGGLFAARMWDRMAKRFVDRIQEMRDNALERLPSLLNRGGLPRQR